MSDFYNKLTKNTSKATLTLHNTKVTGQAVDDLISFLQYNTQINELSFTKVEIDTESIKKIATSHGASNVTQVKVENAYLGDKDVEALLLFPNLTSLNLKSNQIGNEGAKLLAKSKITSLSLANNSVSIDGITALAVSQYLTSLDLSGNNVGNIGAKLLAQNLQLTFLNLRSSGITELGEEFLPKASNLTHLNLSFNMIDGIEESLAESKKLRYLNLSGNPIGDLGANKFAESNIHTVDLGNTDLGYSGFMALVQSKIVDLGLSRNQIGKKTLVHSKITDLGLPGSQVSNENLNFQLPKNQILKKLDLSSNYIDSKLIDELIELQNLEDLDLSHNNIRSQDIESLIALQNLESLNLAWNDVRNEGTIKLVRLMKKLRSLDLSGNEINDDAEISFSKLPKLESLNLSWNDIGSQIVRDLASSAKNITYLELIGNNNLTAKEAIELVKMPNIRIGLGKELMPIIEKLGPYYQYNKDVPPEVVKDLLFALARKDNQGKVVEYFLKRPKTFPFLINSMNEQKYTLAQIYKNLPNIQALLFKQGSIPTNVIDQDLVKAAKSPQSVHVPVQVQRDRFFTHELINQIGTDSATLLKKADDFKKNVSELFSQTAVMAIKLLDLTENEKKEAMRTTLDLDGPIPSDQEFVKKILDEVGQVLTGKYLNKEAEMYHEMLQYDWREDSPRITFNELLKKNNNINAIRERRRANLNIHERKTLNAMLSKKLQPSPEQMKKVMANLYKDRGVQAFEEFIKNRPVLNSQENISQILTEKANKLGIAQAFQQGIESDFIEKRSKKITTLETVELVTNLANNLQPNLWHMKEVMSNFYKDRAMQVFEEFITNRPDLNSQEGISKIFKEETGLDIAQAFQQKIEDDFIENRRKKITTAEAIGLIASLAEKAEPSLNQMKSLVATFYNNYTTKSRAEAFKALEGLTRKTISDLFKEKTGLDIVAVFQEQAKFILAMSVYAAANTYGKNEDSCPTGRCAQIISTVEKIMPEINGRWVKHQEDLLNKEAQKDGVTEKNIMPWLETCVGEVLLKRGGVVLSDKELADVLYDLAISGFKIHTPEKISLSEQKILSLINSYFLDHIKEYLPNFTGGKGKKLIPTLQQYEILVKQIAKVPEMKNFLGIFLNNPELYLAQQFSAVSIGKDGNKKSSSESMVARVKRSRSPSPQPSSSKLKRSF